MINTYKNGTKECENFINSLAKRAVGADKTIETTVAEIIEDVKKNGDKAVEKYTLQFDGQLPSSWEVSREEINDALTEADEDFVYATLNAIENITSFHNMQKEHGFMHEKDGIILGHVVRPLEKVGLYVPGGTAAYPSSVLMNVIPAKIAGVSEIIIVTPPLKDGTANKDILTAAALCGVDRIFTVGGAQAVAALAYGTESIPKVDKIVGPGNIFVTTAKKMLYGTVDIDMVAGPSEILVLADESANPKFVAADLMSQAEHDVLASAILVTTSEKLAKSTATELENQIKTLSRKDIIEKSLSDFGAIILCENMDKAINVSNKIAPEHLEVMTNSPFELLGKIRNAGSIFLGHFSPEPLGDYYAGANHVLPTNGTSRFFSPLGVYNFVKKSAVIFYNEKALAGAKDDILLYANRERLTAHANSIAIRG
jgi:histidinol dehydrogenase